MLNRITNYVRQVKSYSDNRPKPQSHVQSNTVAQTDTSDSWISEAGMHCLDDGPMKSQWSSVFTLDRPSSTGSVASGTGSSNTPRTPASRQSSVGSSEEAAAMLAYDGLHPAVSADLSRLRPR